MQKSVSSWLVLFAVILACTAPQNAHADDPPSAVGAIMRLLKSGRIPESRLDSIVALVCQKGNEHDLGYVFEQLTDGDTYPAELQLNVLNWLTEAAELRKVKPTGDLTKIEPFLSAKQPEKVQLAAVKLAGLWKTKKLAAGLKQTATDASQSTRVRTAALMSLGDLDRSAAMVVINELATANQPVQLRVAAVSALAEIDIKSAAILAAQVLQDNRINDPAKLMDTFINIKGGTDQLADQLQNTQFSKDAAKLALRHLYSVGRSDAKLNAVLSKAAGINENPKPLSKQEVAQLASEVIANGNIERGEQVFRRADLSCMKCHSVSKAGGNVGPDLSAVGGSSPVDYLINSIVDPDQAVKEQYRSATVLTLEKGLVLSGIIVDHRDDRIVLREVSGATKTIPADDVDEIIEGKSLMPKGLVKLMTRQELIDLVRFLTALGKPKEYPVRSTETIQRWRVLTQLDQELLDDIPSDTTFQSYVLDLDPALWMPVYAKAMGSLPLGDLIKYTRDGVVYIQGENRVTESGEIGIEIVDRTGINLWVNNQPLPMQNNPTYAFPSGINKITLRIDRKKRKNDEVKVTLRRITGSAAQFEAVGGR